MALITRLSRLFTADLHAVLDHIEEPEVLLRQAVRDMEAAVAGAEARLRDLEARAEQLQTTLAAARPRLARLDEELQVCLDDGNDALARSVLQRKLGLQRQLADLDARHTSLERRRATEEQTLTHHRLELEALHGKAAALGAAPDPEAPLHPAPLVTADEVEVALLEEKQRRARP